MVKWIVLAVVLLSLLILALAVRPVLVRLPGLRRAALALQGRQAEAEVLQRSAIDLQDQIVLLQQQAEVTQRRIAVIQAKRGE